ncbi:MAG TPA: metal ABC transporter permease [Ktedonobacteraceae bacterium]|jgi:zinc/manganese transport system permease protein
MNISLPLASTPYFSWNILAALQDMLRYPFMRNAFLAGTVIAIVAGIVGYFVVLRGLSFAGHALSHVGFAGATAAVVIGMNPFYGMLMFSVGGSLIMGFLGKRLHGRDNVVGIILAWTMGLGVFFLTLYAGYANEAYAILFGQILGISQSNVVTTLITGIITLVALVCIFRPLLFSSLDEEVAEARGIPTRLIAILFMIILALAVTAAVEVVGILLIFALLVTPAAIADRLSGRPTVVLLLSVILSVLFTWLGLIVSFYVPYPVSFFITSFAFLSYIIVRAVPAVQGWGSRSSAKMSV